MGPSEIIIYNKPRAQDVFVLALLLDAAQWSKTIIDVKPFALSQNTTCCVQHRNCWDNAMLASVSVCKVSGIYPRLHNFSRRYIQWMFQPKWPLTARHRHPSICAALQVWLQKWSEAGEGGAIMRLFLSLTLESSPLSTLLWSLLNQTLARQLNSRFACSTNKLNKSENWSKKKRKKKLSN